MTDPLVDEPHRIRAALEAGECDDATFDRLYTGRIREISWRFWSPVAVAYRASAWLAQLGARRVLDVGSGPGKFCIVAGGFSPRLSFSGVEQRADLVTVARRAASRLALGNVTFTQGMVTEIDWNAYDGFYFFNTFGENLHALGDDRFDDAVELSSERYRAEVAWTEHRLAALPIGKIVVTYHGFGGGLPAAFDLVGEEACGSDRLRVWLKVESWRSGCWYELYGGGVRRGSRFTFGAAG